MEIIKYMYRRPEYLDVNNLDKIDSICIHHTANNNSIDVNTNHHMDNKGWNYNGYGYYIVNGIIYEVRGYKYKNASVKDNNGHIISLAVQGDYNSRIPAQRDIDALQWLIDYLKKELPQIKNLEGHNYWNQTSCPGRFFPMRKLKLNENQFFDKVNYEDEIKKLNKEIEEIKAEQRQIKSILSEKLQIRIR